MVKKNMDIEYPFEHGKCIITPSHYKDTGILPNSVAGDGYGGFHHEANCDFKTSSGPVSLWNT